MRRFGAVFFLEVVLLLQALMVLLELAQFLEFGRHQGAELLTCDAHFKGLPDVALFAKMA